MKKCGSLVLLAVAVLSGVEGLRLKTVAKEPGTTTDEVTLDFDQMPEEVDLDFYAEKMKATGEGEDLPGRDAMGRPLCDKASLDAITSAEWEALNFDGAKTPSNLCHAYPEHGQKSYFCFSGSCKDLGDGYFSDCDTLRATMPDTDDGWTWDELAYDANFKCKPSDFWLKTLNDGDSTGPIHNYALNSCTGPVPSDSCASNTAYCWQGKCIDVMTDPKVCEYAPHGLTRGKDTDDGWDWQATNYDLRAGCDFVTTEDNPVMGAYIPADLVDDSHGMFEPARQIFMQRYLIWCEYMGWYNNRQSRIASGRTYQRATNLKCAVGRSKMDTTR